MTATTARHTQFKWHIVAVVIAVLLAHMAVLALLANMQPATVKQIEAPKPVQVKFVQLAPKPSPVPPKPKPKPKPKPPKPKEVKVVKQPPKPKPPKPVVRPKPKPVIATETVSKQPQAVVAPEPVAPPAPPAPVVTPTPVVAPEPPPVAAPPEPVAPPAPAEPKTVEGVAYKKLPRFSSPSDRELNGRTLTVVVRVLINTSGRVESAEITQSSGVRSVDRRALREIKRATFHPYRENGVAQPVYKPVPFVYQPSSS